MTVFTPGWFGTLQAPIGVDYTYDSAGRAATTRISGITYSNTYDGMGRLVSLADDRFAAWSLPGVQWVQDGQYDAAGRMTSMQLFTGSSVYSPPSDWSAQKTQTMTYNANG